MDPNEIELHTASATAGLSLKRKRDEGMESQSEGEEIGSDDEYGWTGDDDPINTKELAT